MSGQRRISSSSVVYLAYFWYSSSLIFRFRTASHASRNRLVGGSASVWLAMPQKIEFPIGLFVDHNFEGRPRAPRRLSARLPESVPQLFVHINTERHQPGVRTVWGESDFRSEMLHEPKQLRGHSI